MALINTLRNKMGKIVVAAIMITMLSFILTDLIGNSSLLNGGQDLEIAEMDGQTITNPEFQQKVDELSYTYIINTNRSPVQSEIDQIRVQAWNALIIDNVYQNQFDELGIDVTDQELIDMVQGKNISPQIVQFFSNPETGQFSVDFVTNFLSGLSQASDQQRDSWVQFERSLIPGRKLSKYSNLLALTNYVTQAEAKGEYTGQEASATIDYVYVPYLAVADSEVSYTEDDLESYLSENENEYQRDESRKLDYVVFEVIPSAADSAVIVEEIQAVKEELANVPNDSAYAAINSDDSQFFFFTYNNETLPDSLSNKEVGYVTEPAIVGDAYEVYKLSRKNVITSDSIIYKVAKVKKDFFESDETINEVYRRADLFAASAGNEEEFRRLAEEQALEVRSANRIQKNASRVGALGEARSLVSWLYNDGRKGAVSDVKEIGEDYIVALMTDEQEKGVANLDEVRNQVEQKVKNELKADIIISKLNDMDAEDFDEVATQYGDRARSGDATVNMSSNSVSGVGYAPEAIGIAFALEEGETTNPFAIQGGVMIVRVTSKEEAADQENYNAYAQTLLSGRGGSNAVVADFPLSYFRIFVPRNVDESLKEYADIEDMRYKFF